MNMNIIIWMETSFWFGSLLSKYQKFASSMLKANSKYIHKQKSLSSLSQVNISIDNQMRNSYSFKFLFSLSQDNSFDSFHLISIIPNVEALRKDIIWFSPFDGQRPVSNLIFATLRNTNRARAKRKNHNEKIFEKCF